MNSFLVLSLLISVTAERLNELISSAVDWIFLLEERVELVLGLLGVIFLHVDGVLKHLGVVH